MPPQIPDETAEKYRAPALEKGLDILELLARHGDGLSQGEVAKALARSQGEIYRMLTTLVRRGYVMRPEGQDRYFLSLKMFSLSQRHPPVARLIEIALPLMRAVTSVAWQSCHLSMESNGEIVIVASVDSPGNWGLALRVGSVIGLANTGTGRVLAAFRPLSEAEDMVARHKPAMGEPPMDRALFFADLDRIRADGFDIRQSETAVGVTNLTYPVFGPDGRAVTTVSCPYLERIDGLSVPSLSEVRQHYAGLAAQLTFHYGGVPPQGAGPSGTGAEGAIGS